MKARRVIALLAFAASPALALRLAPNGYEGGRSRDAAAREVRNSSSIAIMLGEFRTSLSDLLFIKTERYLDSGVAYMPHLEENLESVQGETAAIDEHQEEVAEQAAGETHEHGDEHGHGHEGGDFAGTPTIIRTPAQDFRGFIGWLHREVKPWRDPRLGHNHTDGTELLPWYRVMTMADPHNVRGYAIGSWWLTDLNASEAERFVREGIAANPDAFQLHYTLGRVLLEEANAMPVSTEAERAAHTARLEEAHASFLHATELAIAQRPPGGYLNAGESGWTDGHEDDALGAARLAVMLEETLGETDVARRHATEYMGIFGIDYTLERHAATQASPEPQS